MRELERRSKVAQLRVAIVGRGRLGSALSRALRERGVDASEPLGRGADPEGFDVVLLCVADAEISAAAALITTGPQVGHCSGATGLDALAPHEGFSLHPLMTVAASDGAQRFEGAGAAIAGSTPRALGTARRLAVTLGMRPFELADADRAAYHAAASVASNFLVTLEGAAERLAAGAGADREALVPLVRATVDNWARLGAERALTGPVARGDERTVVAHRDAVAERAPDLLDMFDALVDATRAVAGRTAHAAGDSRPMRTLRSVSELRSVLGPLRREQRSIGLVPTMGAFHDGHLSLIRAAREECDVVVVSLFVNPAQFNDPDDLVAYPRDERRDAALAQDAGVDYLFAPAVRDVYPPGFSTTVSVAGVTERLESAHRGAGHFDGVTTVVTKLLNMVGPDVAYFGQKDAQQAAVIRRLVSDLDLPVRIEVRPIVRAQDGVALSSRNALLSDSERHRAASLHRALQRIRESIQAGTRDPAAARAAGLAELNSAGIELDYLELVSPETFTPATTIDGEVLAVVAARVGSTRLIDNDLIKTPNPDHQVATPTGAPTT